MAYNVADLLEKFIAMESNGYELYMKIASSGEFDERIKTMARVFAREEKRHMSLYRKIKKSINTNTTNYDIDVDVYDKASKLFMEFSKRHSNIYINNPRELLQYAVDFEKENLAIALSVQGFLVRTLDDVNTEGYKILSEVIKEEEKHVKNIEAFLNDL